MKEEIITKLECVKISNGFLGISQDFLGLERVEYFASVADLQSFIGDASSKMVEDSRLLDVSKEESVVEESVDKDGEAL